MRLRRIPAVSPRYSVQVRLASKAARRDPHRKVSFEPTHALPATLEGITAAAQRIGKVVHTDTVGQLTRSPMPQDRGVGLFVFSVRSNPSDHTYKVRLDGYEIAATPVLDSYPEKWPLRRHRADGFRLRVTRPGGLRNQGAAKSVRWNSGSDLAQFVRWCFES
jgi:hypothetical protein